MKKIDWSEKAVKRLFAGAVILAVLISLLRACSPEKGTEAPKVEESKRESVFTPMLPKQAVDYSPIHEGAAEVAPVQEAEEDPEEKKREAMTALFAINHINWVVTKIKTFNNPAVLEEEYNALTADALNLRAIKDPEIIDIICQILDTITEMRIEATEREFIKDELDQGMANALSDAVGGVSFSGLSPLSMVANAITSAAQAAYNYRKAKLALAAKAKRQNWELEKHKLDYLNELNKELLRNFWQIVQKYPDLPEEYRVSEKDIQLLVDHLKDEDAVKRHEFLKYFKYQFAAFLPYWYHRGAAAYEVSRMETLSKEQRAAALVDAETALRSYMELLIKCGNVMRRDVITAKASLLLATILAETKTGSEKDFRDAIFVAINSTTADDWQTAYFCAMLAIQELNDVRLAEEILAPVISELDWQKRRRLVDWKDQAMLANKAGAGNKVEALIPAGDALYECRTLIARIGKDKLDDAEYLARLRGICEDQSASVRDKLYSYGAMGYDRILEKLGPDIEKMRMTIEDREYVFSVPFSWVIARSPKMELSLDKTRLSIVRHDLDEREDGQYAKIIYERTTRTIQIREDFKFQSQFKIGNDLFMIEVYFPSLNGNDRTARKPKKAVFGKWIEEKKPEASHWAKKADGETDDVEVIAFDE